MLAAHCAPDLLEAIVLNVNYVAAFLWVLLVLVIVFVVTLRCVFGLGSIMLEEIQWHIYGVGFVLAPSYALVADRHVRIDVLAERLPLRGRAWIELVGLVVFLIPFCVAVILEAIPSCCAPGSSTRSRRHPTACRIAGSRSR